MNNKLKVKGQFKIEHFDNNGKLLNTYEINNAVTDEGIEALLDCLFNAGAAFTNSYMGLINNSGYTGTAVGDTMASHAGWTELTTYSEGTRPEWNPDAAASRQVTNSVTVDFSISGTVNIKGIFICDDDTKGGSSGVLWSTSLASSVIPASSGDTLKMTYTVSG